MESVHVEGHVASRVEADPLLPLGTEVIGADGLHEGGEGLVEPDAFPPLHSDEVAEPHVGDFVVNDFGDTFDVTVGTRLRVDQEGRVAERDQTQVLHGAGREVGNGDEVKLVAGVGDVEVVGEELNGVNGRLHTNLSEVALADGVDHAHRDTADNYLFG